MRAQTSLPALGFALLVLTGVLVLGVAVADGSLVDADRPALERQAAVDLSDRLVAPDSPLTERGNVVNRSAVAAFDAGRLRSRYGLRTGTEATISLEGSVIASTGSVEAGTTITRLVVVESVGERTLTPAFTGRNSVTLPRRSRRARISIAPPNATVTTVRANDRVVLHNDSGLRGRFEVSLSPYRTTTFRFESTAHLTAGSVDITYYPTRTEKARLEVTVDG
ncbi:MULTISPECIES: DUF7263 family protein [Salinibaculum]|uniref:DUF7263 family protein n=1 Tax=Salinibaculum TaxID=2732368 RepID=UPI0030CD2FAE